MAQPENSVALSLDQRTQPNSANDAGGDVTRTLRSMEPGPDTGAIKVHDPLGSSRSHQGRRGRSYQSARAGKLECDIVSVLPKNGRMSLE